MSYSMRNPELLKKQILENRNITSDNCWLWTKGRTGKGYGCLKLDGFVVTIHRLSLKLFKPEEFKSRSSLFWFF